MSRADADFCDVKRYATVSTPCVIRTFCKVCNHRTCLTHDYRTREWRIVRDGLYVYYRCPCWPTSRRIGGAALGPRMAKRGRPITGKMAFCSLLRSVVKTVQRATRHWLVRRRLRQVMVAKRVNQIVFDGVLAEGGQHTKSISKLIAQYEVGAVLTKAQPTAKSSE